MDVLSIEYRIRKGEIYLNGSSVTERPFIDSLVSGQSLGKIFGIHGSDLIGVFGWSENKQIDVFLGIEKPELKTGRIPIYVCPECGDIGCGAITTKIEFSDNYVVWKDFGYENDYSEPNLEDFKETGPFIFNNNDYIKIFEKIKQIINYL